MPIKIAEELPARSVLEQENIFVMSELRAQHQDIRPLRIAILNLMPKKIETETQLMRLLSNTPLQVEPTLLQMASHVSRHTDSEHLTQFYKTFADVRHEYFDGMVITGAPVEQLPFEEVDYWEELSAIFRWSRKHVCSTLHICWGAQAGLYYHYGIEKTELPQKLFGIFTHKVLEPNHPLMRGFDEEYVVPHSRYTASVTEQILACDRLQVLSRSEEAGLHIIASRDNRQFFVTGHSEYDRDTLAQEYYRDTAKGLGTALPQHYFPNDDPTKEPPFVWRGHAHLLFANWLNYFVYQQTPYTLDKEFEG